jgi:hypothetical protein
MRPSRKTLLRDGQAIQVYRFEVIFPVIERRLIKLYLTMQWTIPPGGFGNTYLLGHAAPSFGARAFISTSFALLTWHNNHRTWFHARHRMLWESIKKQSPDSRGK